MLLENSPKSPVAGRTTPPPATFRSEQPKRGDTDTYSPTDEDADWGTYAQLAGTVQDMADVDQRGDTPGNRDGLWGNEDLDPGTSTGMSYRNPLAIKANQLLNGPSREDAITALVDFRQYREAEWGRPVSALEPGTLIAGSLFLAQKAVNITRLGLTPEQVTEGHFTASGSVDGHEIPDRNVFYQRFHPTTEPAGVILMVSPGFIESGRNFLEQLRPVLDKGVDVITFDQQWVGQSTGGDPGGFDSGFSLMRDSASALAFAEQIRKEEYGDLPNSQIVLFGNSMGAGPGGWGTLTMMAKGAIQLEGAELPERVKGVFTAPFLGATPSIENTILGAASKIPFINRVALPATGLPIVTDDPVAAQKVSQLLVLENTKSQIASFSTANPAIERIKELNDAGVHPRGPITIVHGKDDTLAHSAPSNTSAKNLPQTVELRLLDTSDHVLGQSERHRGEVIQAVLDTIAKK